MPRGRKAIPLEAAGLRHRFARRLRQLMEKNSWSSKDVAAAITKAGLAISDRGIDAWLRCDTMPRLDGLETIGRALGYKDYRDLLPPPL